MMGLAGSCFSAPLALAASHARPLEETDAPGLRGAVVQLSRVAGIPAPALHLIPSEQPNAFAVGRSSSRSAVAVTRGLLTMPPEHVRAVLAHELAHIRNRDVLVYSITATIAGAVAAVANLLQLSFLFGNDEEEDGARGRLGALSILVLAPVAAMLLQLAVSRQRKYLADAAAARLLGESNSLATALEQLERSVRAHPMRINPAFASLYIANPLRPAGRAALFSTHPPTRERVRRLRRYDVRVPRPVPTA